MGNSTFTYDSNRLTPAQLKHAYEADIQALEKELHIMDYLLKYPEIYELNEIKQDEIKEKRKNIFFQLNNLKTEYELSEL
jgi:hypothetical protein